MLDIHCHLLPGLDDGAKTAAETRLMLARAARAGIDAIIATPHSYSLGSDDGKFARAYAAARALADAAGIRLYPGREVNWRSLPDCGEGALDAMCAANTRVLLLELPTRAPLPNEEFILADLCDRYSVIVAHPEKYLYVQEKPDVVRAWLSAGCELQLDADSLCASLVHPARRAAARILKRGWARYIASDAHSAADYEFFERARKKLGGDWPKGGALDKALTSK